MEARSRSRDCRQGGAGGRKIFTGQKHPKESDNSGPEHRRVNTEQNNTRKT